MTREVASCAPRTTLGRAAQMMRAVDVGVLPVVRDGKPIGVVTDRDICIALAERGRRPSELTVTEIMSRGVECCFEEDNVRKALATMRAKRVRRLPVVGGDGRLVGILSVNDVILHTEPTGGQAVSYEDTIRTLQRICEHRYPVQPAEPEDVTELARFV